MCRLDLKDLCNYNLSEKVTNVCTFINKEFRFFSKKSNTTNKTKHKIDMDEYIMSFNYFNIHNLTFTI